MKICFPVKENKGLNSPVFNHFGSAPIFIMVDSETGEVTELINRDLNHSHGACQPIKALDGAFVDAVVTGGIGGGAINGLGRAGIAVYRAKGVTIGENLNLLASGSLFRLLSGDACGGHGHPHGCAH